VITPHRQAEGLEEGVELAGVLAARRHLDPGADVYRISADGGGGARVGGLEAANARAAAAVGAYALDVSSGVEMAPGRKDAGKLHDFFEALRLPVRGDHSSC